MTPIPDSARIWVAVRKDSAELGTLTALLSVALIGLKCIAESKHDDATVLKQSAGRDYTWTVNQLYNLIAEAGGGQR